LFDYRSLLTNSLNNLRLKLHSNSANHKAADNSATPPPVEGDNISPTTKITELYENNTTQGIERPQQPRGDRNRLTEYPKGDLGRK
jgi:hypothetical protein